MSDTLPPVFTTIPKEKPTTSMMGRQVRVTTVVSEIIGRLMHVEVDAAASGVREQYRADIWTETAGTQTVVYGPESETRFYAERVETDARKAQRRSGSARRTKSPAMRILDGEQADAILALYNAQHPSAAEVRDEVTDELEDAIASAFAPDYDSRWEEGQSYEDGPDDDQSDDEWQLAQDGYDAAYGDPIGGKLHVSKGGIG